MFIVSLLRGDIKFKGCRSTEYMRGKYYKEDVSLTIMIVMIKMFRISVMTMIWVMIRVMIGTLFLPSSAKPKPQLCSALALLSAFLIHPATQPPNRESLA